MCYAQRENRERTRPSRTHTLVVASDETRDEFDIELMRWGIKTRDDVRLWGAFLENNAEAYGRTDGRMHDRGLILIAAALLSSSAFTPQKRARLGTLGGAFGKPPRDNGKKR